jgi:hypothetical protein
LLRSTHQIAHHAAKRKSVRESFGGTYCIAYFEAYTDSNWRTYTTTYAIANACTYAIAHGSIRLGHL